MNSVISFLSYLAKSNLINFLLMVGLLAWIVVKMNLKKSMDDAVAGIEKSIKKSEQEKENSLRNRDEAKSSLDKLPQEVSQIEKFAQQKSVVYEKQLSESAQKSISALNDNAVSTIEIEEKKISSNLQDETVKKSINRAKENIISKLNSEPDLHTKFIDESLEEFNRVKL